MSSIHRTTVAVVALTVAVATVVGTRWGFVFFLALLFVVRWSIEVLEPVQVRRLSHSKEVKKRAI